MVVVGCLVGVLVLLVLLRLQIVNLVFVVLLVVVAGCVSVLRAAKVRMAS